MSGEDPTVAPPPESPAQPPARNANKAYIFNPAQKRLRAIGIVRARLKMSKADVAKAFNVSTRTVERALSWASKANILAEEEDRILEDMLPLAREVILKQMTEQLTAEHTDASVALELYKGTGLLKKPGTKAAAFPGNGEDEIELEIARIRERAALIEGSTAGQLALPPSSEEDPTE